MRAHEGTPVRPTTPLSLPSSTQLLNQLDGFEATNQIKVLMATNPIDILDAALLRPGRIDRKVREMMGMERKRGGLTPRACAARLSLFSHPSSLHPQIEFPNPSESSHVDILKIHSRKMSLARGIDLAAVDRTSCPVRRAEGVLHGGGHVCPARVAGARHAGGL